jgi:sulfonate transport system permease protein
VYGFSRAQVIRRVIVPSALPALITGLRTASGVAWLYVVAAELIAAQSGLGFLLTDGRELARADLVFASIVLLALCGKATDGGLKLVEARLLSWRPPSRNAPRVAVPGAAAAG